MTVEEIRIITQDDEHIGMLSELLLHDWPLIKPKVQKDLQPEWSFRDEIAIIDSITITGRRRIIPEVLQDKTLKQLHLNHMEIEKIRLLACNTIYWVNMNTDIEKIVKNCPTCLDFSCIMTKR